MDVHRLCGALVVVAGLSLPAAPARAASGDALESVNRVVFAFNSAVQDALFLPAADAYERLVPASVRRSVANVFANLREPVTAVNSGFQGDGANAAAAATRFVINSTLGVLGLFDAATGMGVTSRPEDLGQTLCAHGVPEGGYLVLPFAGPTTLRDLAGSAITIAAGASLFGDGYLGFTAADRAQDVAGTAAAMRREELVALDPYAWQRSAYRQLRQADCRAGAEAPFAIPQETHGDGAAPVMP